MSLLTLITQVTRRIGITAPTAVASSTDPQIVQLMALANEEGQDLSARYPWQALQNESTFSAVATESQGAMTTVAGAGFRYVLNDVMWNRTLIRPVFGPLVPFQWQQLKAQTMTGPWTQFRIRGGLLRFIPVPTAGDTIAFEWISKYWATGAAGDASTWAADADTSYLDEETMAQGIIWRWQEAKGLAYAESYAKYERLVADLMARDGGKQSLNMGGGSTGYGPGIMVPSGSWSVP